MGKKSKEMERKRNLGEKKGKRSGTERVRMLTSLYQ